MDLITTLFWLVATVIYVQALQCPSLTGNTEVDWWFSFKPPNSRNFYYMESGEAAPHVYIFSFLWNSFAILCLI
jgi:hypothetical protein